MALRDFGEGFLGRCVVRPFRRDKKGDFANEGGAALVKAAVGQVLGTICDSGATSGELPWRTDFGSQIELLRHSSEAIVPHLARVYVLDALQRWEPRVLVKDVKIVTEYVDGVASVTLQVLYDIASSSTPGSAIVARDLVAETLLS